MCKLTTPWKLLISSILFTVAVWPPNLVHAAPLTQSQESMGETIRLMVKLDPAKQEAGVTVLSESANSENELSKVGWEVVEVDAANAETFLAELQATQGIIDVTPDYPLELAWNPNDPGFTGGNQWSLDKIGADIAWEFSSGQAITVAVIDSGIDNNHPDLVGRIVPGYNFVDKNTDTTDLCGHGTHVAGIIAAQTDNAVGVAGLAHQAVIMPVKVIGDSCLGSYSRLMQGIIWAVDHGARIISITSGGGFDHDGLHDSLVYARSKGVLIAVAAGNRGNALPFYPGSYEEAFTVAGTDNNDSQYNMSNFGEQIDLSAPAVAIYSTYWDKDQGSTYAYMTGTSMAAPHVAAVAALVLAIDPKLSLTDLENTLTNSATDLGEAGWDSTFGWGRLTAWRAVAAVSPAVGNVRLGHFRVPEMDASTLSDVSINAGTDSIELTWAQGAFNADQSVVIYRSPFPVFEAAEDVAEVAAAASGSYSDSNVEADTDYFYWLVQADNDVELAISDSYTTKLATTPLAPEEPETPEEPGQTTRVAMYIPFVEQ